MKFLKGGPGISILAMLVFFLLVVVPALAHHSGK